MIPTRSEEELVWELLELTVDELMNTNTLPTQHLEQSCLHMHGPHIVWQRSIERCIVEVCNCFNALLVELATGSNEERPISALEYQLKSRTGYRALQLHPFPRRPSSNCHLQLRSQDGHHRSQANTHGKQLSRRLSQDASPGLTSTDLVGRSPGQALANDLQSCHWAHLIFDDIAIINGKRL